MIEHYEDETIVTSYDPEILRRLLAYVRPHRTKVTVALLCLLIATIGEMLVPVVIQRTVDHEILDFRVRIDRDTVSLFEPVGETIEVAGSVYVREEVLDNLDRTTREDLRRKGAIDPGRSLVVSREALDNAGLTDDFVLRYLQNEDEERVVLDREILDAISVESRRALRAKNFSGIRRQAVFFFGILLAVLVASFGQVYLTAFTGQLVMKELRLSLFDHTIRQNLAYLGNQAVGKLVTRVTNDVETVNELFTSVIAELLRNLSLMLAVVVTMFTLNARLAAYTVASMIPVVIITMIFRERARNAYRRARRAISRVNAFLAEYISGMSIVQLFVQEDRGRREFSERNQELLGANLAEMYVFAVFRPIVDFLSTLSTAVVIFIGARLLSFDLVSIGILIAFVNLIRRFYMPVMSISEQFTILQSALAGSERIFAMLDEVHHLPDDGTADATEIRGSIAFDNVHFGYKTDEPVLKGLSFAMEPGMLYAVVGYTGAGKTTIINLLTRLWDVDDGRITLDGRDIRDYRLDALRNTVQQIQQDVFLFNATIRENIALGREVSEETIRQACHAVQVLDLVESLPEGLDTVVQQRGANLSAGQRQLIAFARVLVHDPPVLVLDEATSSIDSLTERRLQEAVQTVTGGRTSLVVAHRLSTIRHADRILVLSHGHLVESGKHEELLRSGGLYATLYRLQFEER